MKARRNPFRSDRVEAFRYRLPEDDWEALQRRFEALGRRAAVVGPHGTGKTVFAEDFQVRLEARGSPTALLRFHDRFTPEDRERLEDCCTTLAPSAVLILDGGELLPPRAWRKLLARLPSATGILATLHRARRLPLLHQTRPQLEIARELVRSLLGRPLDPRESAALEERFQRSGGNIREVVRSFYLEFASLPSTDSSRNAKC